MSASDNLSRALFHGSGHDFVPGDIVEPRHSAYGYGAFASHYPSIARIYASGLHGMAPEGQQGRLFGTVWEVEPLEGDTPRPDAVVGEHMMSDKGFRVVRPHSYVVPDWRNAE